MITRRTKMQLAIFVVITLIGCTYVGARYAELDRFFYDDSYAVTVHLAQSGGIYEGAEVTYRGVGVGSVDRLDLTEDGVDAHLEIDRSEDRIPADTEAVVGNRSAIGEQYVELQPQVKDAPYLHEGSQIATADTSTPIPTEKLLYDVSRTVESIDKKALRTSVHELGAAMNGSGQDLQTILDSTSSFVDTADANFGLTKALLRDSNTVLRTQVGQESSLRSFARDLGSFTDTMVKSDQDLRSLITNGSAGARELRDFLAENQVDLGELLNNLITTGRIVRANLDSFEMVLTVYPYVVEGGFTVAAKTPETGMYDAHFGLVLTTAQMCTNGYGGTHKRPPQELQTQPFNEDAHCADSPEQSNPRGAQNAEQTHVAQRAPVAAYDPETGSLAWGADARRRTAATTRDTARPRAGEEAWSWLYLSTLDRPR